MHAGPMVGRILAVALALVCVGGAVAAQDDEEEPFVPGLPGYDPTLDPLAPKQRQWTALQLLKWEWSPGLAPTHGEQKELPVKEALHILSDNDERPLLIQRDCAGCERDDHDLVLRELENERTILMGRWFHAVRVDDDVLAEKHPFHGLFEGKTPPHLVAATLDGATVSAVAARANSEQVGKTLAGVLRKAYRKDPASAVKSLVMLLDDFDRVDRRLKELDEQLGAARREKGVDSREVADLEAKRKEIDAERAALLEKGKQLDDLGLKVAPEPPAPG